MPRKFKRRWIVCQFITLTINRQPNRVTFKIKTCFVKRTWWWWLFYFSLSWNYFFLMDLVVFYLMYISSAYSSIDCLTHTCNWFILKVVLIFGNSTTLMSSLYFKFFVFLLESLYYSAVFFSFRFRWTVRYRSARDANLVFWKFHSTFIVIQHDNWLSFLSLYYWIFLRTNLGYCHLCFISSRSTQ